MIPEPGWLPLRVSLGELELVCEGSEDGREVLLGSHGEAALHGVVMSLAQRTGFVLASVQLLPVTCLLFTIGTL